MRSASSSCLTTFVVLIALGIVVKYAFPGAAAVFLLFLKGTLFVGLLLFLLAILTVGYFTYRNLRGNKAKEEAQKYARVTRTEVLYKTVIDRLQGAAALNQVTAEELLQSEVLMTEKMQQLKQDLVRLKEFTSPKNEKLMNQQTREYRQQLQQTADDSAKQMITENLKMMEEKKQRHLQAIEEIRQKEALVDLVYNRLVNIEEDLKFGRTVERLFPAELYSRFDLTPPSDRERLPPLSEKSSQ